MYNLFLYIVFILQFKPTTHIKIQNTKLFDWIKLTFIHHIFMSVYQLYNAKTGPARHEQSQPGSKTHAATPVMATQRFISGFCDVKLVSCVLHVANWPGHTVSSCGLEVVWLLHAGSCWLHVVSCCWTLFSWLLHVFSCCWRNCSCALHCSFCVCSDCNSPLSDRSSPSSWLISAKYVNVFNKIGGYGA
jgi:hypothetical protein